MASARGRRGVDRSPRPCLDLERLTRRELGREPAGHPHVLAVVEPASGLLAVTIAPPPRRRRADRSPDRAPGTRASNTKPSSVRSDRGVRSAEPLAVHVAPRAQRLQLEPHGVRRADEPVGDADRRTSVGHGDLASTRRRPLPIATPARRRRTRTSAGARGLPARSCRRPIRGSPAGHVGRRPRGPDRARPVRPFGRSVPRSRRPATRGSGGCEARRRSPSRSRRRRR